jgi:virginiamycin A acetyltransferase
MAPQYDVRTCGPDPTQKHPMGGFPQVCYIKNTVRHPRIQIGDFTYYADLENSVDFERNVLYLSPLLNDRLIIGKFCAIASGVKFIMNGANHPLSGLSTYPFFAFGSGWEKVAPDIPVLPTKGDTVIGNDVWIGYESLVMPGVRIGNGAIVASRSVVVSDVEPYTIVGGNPARSIKRRFSDEVIIELQQLGWWNWPVEQITQSLEFIVSGDIKALRGGM